MKRSSVDACEEIISYLLPHLDSGHLQDQANQRLHLITLNQVVITMSFIYFGNERQGILRSFEVRTIRPVSVDPPRIQVMQIVGQVSSWQQAFLSVPPCQRNSEQCCYRNRQGDAIVYVIPSTLAKQFSSQIPALCIRLHEVNGRTLAAFLWRKAAGVTLPAGTTKAFEVW